MKSIEFLVKQRYKQKQKIMSDEQISKYQFFEPVKQYEQKKKKKKTVLMNKEK